MQYVAPARRVLDQLHITDAPGIVARGVQPGTVLRCGVVVEADDLWWPVDRRDSDKICAGCEGKPAPVQTDLFA
jgi:hypothetical protein